MSVEFILYTADLRTSRAMYSILLEREPVLDVPGMVEFDLEGCKLGLMPEEGIARIIVPPLPHPRTGNGIPRCEIYLLLPDLNSSMLRALKAGFRSVDGPADRDWGHQVAYFADPDGHVIALASALTSSDTTP